MIALFLILFTHWVSDFLLQTHEMSINKSKSVRWLSYHVLIYSLSTTLIWLIFFYCKLVSGDEIKTFFMVFIVTFTTHFITDFFTSKWTSFLWANNKTHNFFVVIGLDQLIHGITLIATYNYLINEL